MENNKDSNKKQIKIEKQFDFDLDIKENAICKITKAGKITEVQIMDYLPQGIPIKKVSKDGYIKLTEDTGEIHQFNKSENRQENKDSLYKTFKKIRNLINNNFKGGKSELHIILTYAQEMTDTKVLYKDCKALLKKLYRRFPDLEYMQIVEPQARGTWHVHMLAKLSSGKKFVIPNKELAEMWGKGFVMVKRLEKVDNIGLYLSAYLGDIFLEDLTKEEIEKYKLFDKTEKVVPIEQNQETEDFVKKNKKIVKGGRLHLYPPGMNIYRKSKNIVPPETTQCLYKDLSEQNIKSKDGSPCFKERIVIKQIDPDQETEKTVNTITYLQYHANRKNKL